MTVLLRREWMWLVFCLIVVVLIIAYTYSKGTLSGPFPEEDLEQAGEDVPQIGGGSSSETGEEQAEEQQQISRSEADYFVEYRLERERVRSHQMDILREIVHNPSTDTESRKEAHKLLLEVSQNLEREMELEGLIKAKGFRDVVAFIKTKQVHVVIKAEELDVNQVAQIGDLVQGMCAVPLEYIVIDCHP